MITMITLYAMRQLTSVVILDNKRENIKAIFTNKGYRPTKATKVLTVNCCKYNLKWLDDKGNIIN